VAAVSFDVARFLVGLFLVEGLGVTGFDAAGSVLADFDAAGSVLADFDAAGRVVERFEAAGSVEATFDEAASVVAGLLGFVAAGCAVAGLGDVALAVERFRAVRLAGGSALSTAGWGACATDSWTVP
jgi:YD repeat-containing protein